MKKNSILKGLLIGLMAFVLCIALFGATGASADEAAEAAPTKSAPVTATYNAVDDAVLAGSNAYVYVVKAASGNKIKAGTAAAGQMANNKIKIADLGIKGTKKDVFLYVCDKEVEVEETVAANLTIKGNANKIVGVVDYTMADEMWCEYPEVLSAYYVDKATKKTIDVASDKLYWSLDQEKWYLANSWDEEGGRKGSDNRARIDGFTGVDLGEMLEAGGLVYIKQAGTTGASGTAQFGSAVAKVKIAKRAKAPKVKIDVAKDTIGLKNGFDFAVALKDGNEFKPSEWFTILPVLKTATVGSEAEFIVGGDVEVGNDDFRMTRYKPLGKKDADAGKAVKVEIEDEDTFWNYSYTKYAIKTLSIEKMLEYLNIPYNRETGLYTEFKIAVRKSATEKKPASDYSLVDIDFKAEAPIVWTKDNVKGQYFVASADEFSKKGLALGEIAPFAGYTGTGRKTIATTGFDTSFKIAEATNDTKGRDEGSVFEYAVVATADYYATGDAAIDWTTVKWKKFDPAKLKITEKLSGKYSTVKGTKKTADLKSTASSQIETGEDGVDYVDDYRREAISDDAIKAGTKSLLLIRRQGDKSTGKRASKEIILYVAKEGKKYNLYSTVSNGEIATKYTVVFGKYSAESGNEHPAGFYRDDTIDPIVGWTRKQQVAVKFDDLTDGEYWIASPVADSPKMTLGGSAYVAKTAQNAIAAGENTDAVPAGSCAVALGEYEIGADVTVPVIIREYANVKINAVYGTYANGTFTSIGADKAQLVAEIKGGKACTVTTNNGKTSWADPAANADVVKYVGDESVITFATRFEVPEGYAQDPGVSGYPVIVAGTNYTFPDDNTKFTTEGQSTNAEAKFTVSTAEPVEVTINYAVFRTYKITFDYQAYEGEKSDPKQTDKNGKITLPAPTQDGFVFGGWYDNVGLNGDPVDNNKVYNADTTLYAKWTAQ